MDNPFLTNANSVFIAHARSDVPALVAEIEHLRARLGEAHSFLDAGEGAGVCDISRTDGERTEAEERMVRFGYYAGLVARQWLAHPAAKTLLESGYDVATVMQEISAWAYGPGREAARIDASVLLDEDDYDGEDDPGCQTCCGEGFEECDDILGCFVRGCNGDFHTCPNCKGSGRAKDQWYW